MDADPVALIFFSQCSGAQEKLIYPVIRQIDECNRLIAGESRFVSDGEKKLICRFVRLNFR